jgi:hypothetical protein
VRDEFAGPVRAVLAQRAAGRCSNPGCGKVTSGPGLDPGRAVIASFQPWRVRCLEIRGHAEAIDTPTDSAGGIDGAIIRIHPRRIISFGIDDLDTEPHDLVPSRRTVTEPAEH